jgi:chromosome segregation ATPase
VRNGLVQEAQEYFNKAKVKYAVAKQKLDDCEKRASQAEREQDQLRVRANKVQEANKTTIVGLQQKLEAELKAKADLIKQVQTLRQAMLSSAPALKAPKGFCDLVFSREVNTCHFPQYMQLKAVSLQQQWKALYPTNNLTSGLAGEFAYGESTFGSMARVCHLVSSELIYQNKPLKSNDIFLD